LGKNTRGEKEYTRLQEVIHENKKLKREVAHLRRQLARLDLDRLSYVHEVVQEHYADEEIEKNSTKMLANLKKTWLCKECGIGFLEIVLYNKIGEVWYFRQCSNCDHRTKSQKYTPTVQGIVKEDKKDPKD
jgi:hypothetical protein